MVLCSVTQYFALIKILLITVPNYRPFYSCLLSDMACDSSDTAGDLELIDTDLPVFVMQIVLLLCKLQCICIREPKRFKTKQDHREP